MNRNRNPKPLLLPLKMVARPIIDEFWELWTVTETQNLLKMVARPIIVEFSWKPNVFVLYDFGVDFKTKVYDVDSSCRIDPAALLKIFGFLGVGLSKASVINDRVTIFIGFG